MFHFLVRSADVTVRNADCSAGSRRTVTLSVLTLNRNYNNNHNGCVVIRQATEQYCKVKHAANNCTVPHPIRSTPSHAQQSLVLNGALVGITGA